MNVWFWRRDILLVWSYGDRYGIQEREGETTWNWGNTYVAGTRARYMGVTAMTAAPEGLRLDADISYSCTSYGSYPCTRPLVKGRRTSQQLEREARTFHSQEPLPLPALSCLPCFRLGVLVTRILGFVRLSKRERERAPKVPVSKQQCVPIYRTEIPGNGSNL